MKLLLITLSLVALVGCSDSLDKTGSDNPINDQSDTTLSAITSASGYFRVLGGSIGEESINVEFRYRYANGLTWLHLINEAGKTIHRDTLNIPPWTYSANTAHVHPMSGLQSSTKYRLMFESTYNGKSYKRDTISFTTRTIVE